ncbi:MAG: AraC family transcriptional regulator [Ancrocorticia sp.]
MSRRIYIPPVVTEERVHNDVHLLLWQVRGTGDYVLDGIPWHVEAGHAMWIPSSVRHQVTVHANSVVLRSFFSVEETATTLKEPTLIPIDRELRTVLLAYTQAGDSLLQPHLNLARQILSLIEEQPVLPHALCMPTSEAALAVAESLRFNPGDNRTVEELAEATYTSVRTIERTFKAETGMTLRQWRIKNRMEVAAVLLRAGTNIPAIAHRVGYGNVSSFGRVFKEHFGMTPGSYAAKFGVQP